LGYTFLVGEAIKSSVTKVDPLRLAELCRRWGIRELALFGSALREDFGPDSDVDLLVDFEPETVLGFRVFDLERELSELFGGRRIDLVPRKFLNPRLRQRVLAEAQTQYAA
jgi:predicted nucleotidyltransferase